VGRPLDLDILDVVLGVGRQEELEEPLEHLFQAPEDVGDRHVPEPFLVQDDVAVASYAVGGRLVVEVREAVPIQPLGEGSGRPGVPTAMAIDVDQGEGPGAGLPAVGPEVEGGLPGEMGVHVAVGGAAHEAVGIVPLDQLVVGVAVHAAGLLPAEAVGADEGLEERADGVSDPPLSGFFW
jgi:hypothetical protein